MKQLFMLAVAAQFALPVLADDITDALARCRAMGDSAPRLACYDAIALPNPAAIAEEARRNFGKQVRPQDVEPEKLDTRVAGTIDGWEPNGQITLENGQVWQVIDGSRAYYAPLTRPRVTITHGSMGTYFIDIEGISQSPRVKRVR